MYKINVGGKKLVLIIALILVCVVMGAFGQIFMKKGLSDSKGIEIQELFSTKIFSTVLQPYTFTGIMLYIGAAVVWLTVLSKADVSFAYPMIALGYILAALLAKFFFPVIGLESENIGILRWFGILVIIGGVFLVARG